MNGNLHTWPFSGHISCCCGCSCCGCSCSSSRYGSINLNIFYLKLNVSKDVAPGISYFEKRKFRILKKKFKTKFEKTIIFILAHVTPLAPRFPWVSSKNVIQIFTPLNEQLRKMFTELNTFIFPMNSNPAWQVNFTVFPIPSVLSTTDFEALGSKQLLITKLLEIMCFHGLQFYPLSCFNLYKTCTMN